MLDFDPQLCSVKTLLSRKMTHLLVYECKQMCSDLLGNGVEVQIMWISSHEGLEDNELVENMQSFEKKNLPSPIHRVLKKN
jgi:hypothetical protein